MSMIADAVLSTATFAGKAAESPKENSSVKTTTHSLANNTVRVTKESTEATAEAFAHYNFKVSIYSCDGVLLGSAVYTDYTYSARGCANFFAAMLDWVGN